MRPAFFKKQTPNGKVTLYVNKRDFIDHCDGDIDPVEGLVSVEDNYLCGRKIYVKLIITYRYGREEDEVMGIRLSRDIVLDIIQIVPPCNDRTNQISVAQKTIMERSPANEQRFPFMFQFSAMTPSSIAIQSGSTNDQEKNPLGVDYSVRAFVGESITDPGFKRSTVSIRIKKRQVPFKINETRLPSTITTERKITFEMTLNKETFGHEENIHVAVLVTNNSRKTVKRIKLYVVQHVELTMLRVQMSNVVACLKTRDGCPITPGKTFSKEFTLIPLASSNLSKRGTALDGYLKDEKKTLASSTILPLGKLAPEQIGVNVRYSVRGKLIFRALRGELSADVPLKLLQLPKLTTSDSSIFVISDKKRSKPGWKRSVAPNNDVIHEE